MKTPGILLKTAAILMLIHATGHTLGHSRWKYPSDPGQQQIVKAMTGSRFPFMGKMRSAGDYFDGYGYACSIAMLVFVFTLWFLSSDIDIRRLPNIRLLWVLAAGLLLWGIDEWIWFFPLAAMTSWLASLCTFSAIIFLRKQELP